MARSNIVNYKEDYVIIKDRGRLRNTPVFVYLEPFTVFKRKGCQYLARFSTLDKAKAYVDSIA